MNQYTSPRQRRNQRGSVADRWRKRTKDADGNTVEVPSVVAGKVTRWRARYVDNSGRENQRSYDKKVDAQRWLDAQLASLLRGDYVEPADAKMTLGQWCDIWLTGYGNRRETSVRMAEEHLKIIRARFGAVPLSAIKPSDVRAWTTQLQKEGRAPSYVYALHSRLSQLFTDAVDDDLVARNPCARRTSPPMASRVRTSPRPSRCGHSMARFRSGFGQRS